MKANCLCLEAGRPVAVVLLPATAKGGVIATLETGLCVEPDPFSFVFLAAWDLVRGPDSPPRVSDGLASSFIISSILFLDPSSGLCFKVVLGGAMTHGVLQSRELSVAHLTELEIVQSRELIGGTKPVCFVLAEQQSNPTPYPLSGNVPFPSRMSRCIAAADTLASTIESGAA